VIDPKMRLLLEYFDQNDQFAALLPKSGTVERGLRSLDGSGWALFRLDSQVEYEGHSYDHFLLKSRWQGVPIGGSEPTSVFIVLVAGGRSVPDGFDVQDFANDHVAWGLVRVL
jgi:hypothetical protein